MQEKANWKITRLSPPHDFRATLIRDVRDGFSKEPWSFPSKYLYDDVGSRFYEQLTETKDYYITRTETEILRERAREIMELVQPEEMVELGSGFTAKIRILIEAMRDAQCRRYVPLDISERALREAASAITAEYGWLELDGMLGDFDTDLPKLPRNGRRMIAFLGNTLGNMTSKSERTHFLGKIAAAMKEGDALLLGIDLVKDVSVMLKAYNDSEGNTENMIFRTLDVINRELDGDFPLADFKYVTRWDSEVSGVRMLVQAQRNMKVSVKTISFEAEIPKGYEIHMSISHKFTREQITDEFASVGLQVTGWYTDSAKKCAMVVASV
jgi:L-histidine N-alpha-methyltransferase